MAIVVVLALLAACGNQSESSNNQTKAERVIPFDVRDNELIKQVTSAVEFGISAEDITSKVAPPPNVLTDYPIPTYSQYRDADRFDPDDSAPSNFNPALDHAVKLAVWVRPTQSGLRHPRLIGIVWYGDGSSRMFLAVAGGVDR